MPTSSTTSKISLDNEVMFTTRVLTHKLSLWPFEQQTASSGLASCALSSVHSFVPKFPINELWNILNSLTEGKTSSPGGLFSCVESNWGVSLTADNRSNPEEECDKASVKDSVVLVPHPSSAFKVISSKTDVRSSSPKCSESDPVESFKPTTKVSRSQKYEKKNIYFKAVFRDIRKYCIEKLADSNKVIKKSDPIYNCKYKAFEPSIRHFLENVLYNGRSCLTLGQGSEMVSILAPFLNYNHYMVSVKDKNEKEADIILDCLQNFTLTKMRKVLQHDVLQKLVRYYYDQTIEDGGSSRFAAHKTMSKNPSKYLEVLNKIVSNL